MGKKKYSPEEMRAMQQSFWDRIGSMNKSDLILSGRLYVEREDDMKYDNTIVWDSNKHSIIRIEKNKDK